MSDAKQKPTGVFPANAPQPKKAAAPRVERRPIWSEEAEQGVLGCILISPRESLAQVQQLVSKESFYDLRHQTVYEAICAMADKNDPVEIITLQQRLKDAGRLEQVGGIAYLNELEDSVPSAGNLPTYLDIVLEKHVLRRTLDTCGDIARRVYEFGGDIGDFVDAVERDILAIGTSVKQQVDDDIKKLVQKSIGHIEDLFNAQGAITGLATGFTDLDKDTDGMHGGDLIILAGYPSTGKTSLAMNIVEHVVLKLKLPVAVFSFEMSPQSLVTRLLCSNARVNLRNIRDGYMAESDFPKLTASAGALCAANLHVVKATGMTVGQLRAKARRLHQQHGIKLFVVDYLQKVQADQSRRMEKRSDAVAAVSNGLKDLAMELDVPGLVLSQLNADGGLFMSSETGMDADTIFKLRVDKDSKEWNGGDAVPVALDIEKQRNGPTGTVNLTFLRPYTRYESAAKVSDADVQ